MSIKKNKIDSTGLSNIGKLRKENQDSYYLNDKQGLYIVSDGMGGHQGGAVASKIAVELFPKIIEKRFSENDVKTDDKIKELIQNSISELNSIVQKKAEENPLLRGMGATLVSALFYDDDLYLINIGDSRGYIISKGKILQLTKDHSIIALLLESGQITEEEAKVHPARSQITKCIGCVGKAIADIKTINVDIECKILLCSDGLTNMLEDNEIEKIINKHKDIKEAAAELIEKANEAGGHDNITALLIDIKKGNKNEN